MCDFVGTHRMCEATKREVRTQILAARRTARPEVRAIADASLCSALVDMVHTILTAVHPWPTGRPAEADATTIAAYVPISGEPGGIGLPQALWEAMDPALTAPTTDHPRGRLLLPVLRADLDLDWAEYTGPECLVPAARGLREPLGPRLGRDVISTASLVITPAVAIDSTGVRLGRGGGSYDRALARVPAGTEIVAPLYAAELVASLPAQPHDQRVTAALVAEPHGVRTARLIHPG